MSNVTEERLSKCSTCEHKREGFPVTCRLCNCVIKFKVIVPSAKCPINKW